ncbi:MAG TPA: class II aldolase/adducin family protein [Candidatus Hydrogenedentes bacterium]|nr:class II aldolase/adducin family protein [Candidatus Hydrogenedentota bacterium]
MTPETACHASERLAREQICEAGRILYDLGLVAATDGNLSVRLAPDRFLCTPGGISKGFMTPRDLVIVDARGEKISGTRNPTSEIYTHLAAFEERLDIVAVVHAHPPVATALTIAGHDMTAPVVPEVIMGLMAIPTAGYATPGSREGADVVRPWIGRYDALLLDRHGAITVGADPLEAAMKMDKVEHTARVLHAALTVGRVQRLTPEAVRKLVDFYDSHHARPFGEYPFPGQ